jgi:hypothetical protein
VSAPANQALTRAYQRVIQHADRDETTGCLISRYSVGSHGYAQAFDGKVTLAHLVVWRYVNGPVEDGMTVDHQVCHNRRCVEITHLRLLPNLENARRTDGRDWPLGLCAQGHDESWWMPKTATNKKGYCYACVAAKQARLRGHQLWIDVTKPRPTTSSQGRRS